MKTPIWKPQILLVECGITYTLHFEEGFDINPRTHFIEECGMSLSDYSEISNYYFFRAKIEATKAGEVLSDSYLGGNCYKSLKEVLGNKQLANVLSGYAPQMIEECKEDAEIALQLLIERKEQALLSLKAL